MKIEVTFYDEATQSFTEFKNTSHCETEELKQDLLNNVEIKTKLLNIISDKKQESKTSYVDVQIQLEGDEDAVGDVRLTIDPDRDSKTSNEDILEEFLNDVESEAIDVEETYFLD